MVNERRWLVLIFSLYFFLAVGYSLLMPIWEAPDEPAHYHLAWRLARKNQYASLKINYEAGQPRTFYYMGSWIIRALDQVNPKLSDYYLPKELKFNFRIREHRFEWSDENYRFLLGVYSLRWLNIVFGGLAAWLNWKTFRLLAPERPTLQLAALALAALTPQYLHIMSSVNNDALGTLAGALLFYLGIRVSRDSPSWLELLAIILALLLPFFSKLTLLPVSVALLLIVILKWISGFRRKKWLLILGIAVLTSAGIFYLLFPETVQFAWNEISWRLFSLRKNALTLRYLKLVLNQIVWTYWGKVGWLAVGLNVWVVNILTGLGLFGMALSSIRLIRTKLNDPQFHPWLAACLVAVFTIVAVFRNGLTTYATQGRFLFPAIGALCFLMVSGWHDLLPERGRRFLPTLIVLCMLACNISLWLGGIVPVYYQPFLD